MKRFKILLFKELREVIRDKKSLKMMFVIPLLIPLIIIGFSYMFELENNKTDDYKKIGFCYELSDVEKNILDELEIDYSIGTKKELKEKYDKDEIDLYVDKNDETFILNGKDKNSTAVAITYFNSFVEAYKANLQATYLIKNEINPDEVLNVVKVENKIETDENFFATYITSYGFLFITMAICIGATYPSTDSTAGEKERGTMETLLTFPVKSRDIILSKYFSVVITSIITGLVSLILFGISLNVANGMFDMYKDIDITLSGISIIYAIITIVAYAFLISGLCIAIASKSKTFKEAQSALSPLSFIAMFPSMIAFLLEVKSSYLLSIIPFVNYTMLFDDIVKGNFDIIKVLLMLVSTFVLIFVVLSIIIKQYKSEEVLFG